MKRLPRIISSVAVACSLSFPMVCGSQAWAQAAPAQTPPVAGTDAPPAQTPPPAAGTDAPPAAQTPAPAPGATPPAPAPAPDAGGTLTTPGSTTPTLTTPGSTTPTLTTPGATTPPAATEPAAAPPADVGANETLAQQVDDFWHYGEIGRYDLQAAIGAKIVAAGQQNPQDLLKIFEQVASQHTDLSQQPTDLDVELIRWQGADAKVKPVVTQIIDLLNKGRFARRQDAQYIASNIKRLNQGERAYMLGIAQLRNSGELAVPQLVTILISIAPDDLPYHDVARRALVDLGRDALNPLLAATEMSPKDPALTSICGVLGDIGYPIAAPYLVSLVDNADASSEVKQAARIALTRLNVSAESNPGDLLYGLAEKFYYGSASIGPDPRSPVSFVWYWNNGLSSKQVPPQIFNDIMAMRCNEQALRLNPSQADQAVALWLAANIRRSIDLPAGATDPTRTPEEPSPNYYNVAQGANYLNLVLERSLTDNTPQSPAVALAAIKSLQEIVGQSNLFTAGRGQPLVDAMRYPDRQVRFEAAFALAAALPQRAFSGQSRVVPLLAEAVSQSGTPGVILVAPQADRTRITNDLKSYAVAGGEDPSAAIAEAAKLPAVDVIVMSEDLGGAAIDQMIRLAAENTRLEGAAKLIIVHSLASPWARRALTDPSISTTEATGGPGLAAAIEAARKKAGGLPMDEKTASDFAVRAAGLLAKLAGDRGQVLDLSAAQQTLIAALGDKRVPVAKGAGQALALLNSPAAQSGLADRANDTSIVPEVRIDLYESLATSVKFYGDRLSPEQRNSIQQVVMDEKNLDIRTAAAESRGALNLPAGEVKPLIIQRHD